MSASATPSSAGAGPRKGLHPFVVVAVFVLAVALIGYVGYRWANRPRVPASVYVDAAKYWIEKPEREKLQAQNMPKEQIDAKIKEMWRQGTLKLPPGKPGVDWAGTPNGIVMIPKGPGAKAGQ